MFVRKAESEDWPVLSDTALSTSAADWLAPALYDKASLKEFAAGDLSATLLTLLVLPTLYFLVEERPRARS